MYELVKLDFVEQYELQPHANVYFINEDNST